MKVVKWPSSHTIKFFRQQRIMMINFFIRFSSQVQKRKKKMQVVKNPPANARDASLIPRSGRCPGEGNGNPLQYFCLRNPMDRGAWRASLHGVGRKRVGWDLATEQQISLVSYIIFTELFHLSVLLYKKGMIRKSSPRIATTPKVIEKIKWINAYKVFRMGPGTLSHSIYLAVIINITILYWFKVETFYHLLSYLTLDIYLFKFLFHLWKGDNNNNK